MEKREESAVFGGGCFWCTEAIFASLKGVLSVTAGYAGGKSENPSYEQVCAGGTGHAEVIKIQYDPTIITYQQLLEVFFATHDPTTRNRQGNDVGDQYRSTVLSTTEEQKNQALEYVRMLNATAEYKERPVVTFVEPLQMFYPAERYHQKYYSLNSEQPYCQLIISPKLATFKKKFPHLIN